MLNTRNTKPVGLAQVADRLTGRIVAGGKAAGKAAGPAKAAGKSTLVAPSVERRYVASTGAHVIQRAALINLVPPTKTPHSRSVAEYRVVDMSVAKRGAIHAVLTRMSGRGKFTRDDWVAACDTNVSALGHFYWAKRHGAIVTV